MTYVYLEPEGFQALIDGLTGYSDQTERSHSYVKTVSFNNDEPADLGSFTSTLTEKWLELDDKAADLQARLDAAKAANESGLTFSNPDGMIAYYVPEGMDDTKEVVLENNNVDVVNEARADVETVVDYSQNGCSPEEWDALLARMQQNEEDPAYANAFLANITAEQLLDCPTDIQGKLTHTFQREGTPHSDQPEAATDLCQVLGTLLSTASCTWPNSKASEYAEQLADAAEAKGESGRLFTLNGMLLSSRESDVDGDGTPNSVGLDYNDAMLVSLARRLESYSLEEWDYTSLGDWFEMIDDASSSEAYMPATCFPGNPLAGVVHAMTGNPKAGQEWLAPRPDGQEAPKGLSSTESIAMVERIQGLVVSGDIGDNGWTTDWALLAHEIDTQDWISPVPTAMSRGEREYQDSAGATAVAGILNGIGSEKEVVDLSDETRVVVSAILARHPESVVVVAEPDNPVSPVLETKYGSDQSPRSSFDPLLSDRAAGCLLGQVSMNAAASGQLGEAMAGHYQEKIDAGVSEYVRTGDSTTLAEAVSDQCKTNGFITGAASYQYVGLARRADSRATSSNNVASFLAGLIPVAGPAASVLVSEGKPFSVDNESEALAQANQTRSDASSMNRAQLTVALLNSGVYSAEELLAAAEAAGGGRDVYTVIDGATGDPLTGDMDPSTITSVEVRNGLDLVGNHLHLPGRPELDFAEYAANDHETGYRRAYPSDDGPPAHAWTVEE